MTESDLEAIYVYLQQVPAVRNQVAAFAPDPEPAVTLRSAAEERSVEP